MKELVEEEKRSLQKMNIHELRRLGKRIGVKASTTLGKSQLIDEIQSLRFGEGSSGDFETRGRPSKIDLSDSVYNLFPSFGEIAFPHAAEFVDGYGINCGEGKSGIAEISGSGFATIHVNGFVVEKDDLYVPASIVKKFGLKDGDAVFVQTKKIGNTETVTDILYINGVDSDVARNRVDFFSLRPSYPREKFAIDGEAGLILCDFVSPIGKGQRGILAGEPKSGKSTLLLKLSKAIKEGNSDAFVSPILVSKSIQEVDEFSAVFSSTFAYSLFDAEPTSIIRSISLGVNRALRMAELGRHAVVIVDDFNLAVKAYQKLLVKSNHDPRGALEWVKSLFGLGTALSNGGSLTIIACVDTGSEEGGKIVSELNQLTDLRIAIDPDLVSLNRFPAINLVESSTKKSEIYQSEHDIKISRILKEKFFVCNTREQKIRLFDELYTVRTRAELVKKISQK